MNTTFLDFETSGLNRFFDQPLSFYAKTIDKNGKEIDSIDLSCSLESFRLPSPEALLVNNIPLDTLHKNESLHKMMHKVYGYIKKQSPQLIVGHNLFFDYSFSHNQNFQNLICDDLYHWRLGGNILIDTLQIARSIKAFDEDCGFNIPLDEDNNPVFNQVRLCEVNNISINSAHTAQGDVVSLEKLYECMKKKSPFIFDLARRNSVKKNALEIIYNYPFVLSNTGVGREFTTKILTFVALNPSGTEAILADVTSNKNYLESLSPLEITSFLGNEQAKNFPLVRIPISKGKIFLPSDSFDNYRKLTGLSGNELFRRASEIRRNKHLAESCFEALIWRQNGLEEESDNFVENTIYDCFLTHNEKNFIKSFNLSPPNDRWELIKMYENKLEQDRLIKLSKRVMLEVFPDNVPQKLRAKYASWINQRLYLTPKNLEFKWNTLNSCLECIQSLLVKYPLQNQKIKEIESFYRRQGRGVGLDIKESDWNGL